MSASECTIVIERLDDGGYRAICPLLPDCAAVARTEEAARRAVEVAIERHLRERDLRSVACENLQHRSFAGIAAMNRSVARYRGASRHRLDRPKSTRMTQSGP